MSYRSHLLEARVERSQVQHLMLKEIGFEFFEPCHISIYLSIQRLPRRMDTQQQLIKLMEMEPLLAGVKF